MRATTSVIICSYNYGRFLPRCLSSVVAQTHPPDEIIVVDDGSQDDTPEVVKRYPQVRYIRQENAGKAAAFNRGFLASQGDLICHLDADDYWMPDKLERVTEALSREESGGLIHEAYVDRGGQHINGSERQEATDAPCRRFSFQDVLTLCFIYRPQNTVARSLGVCNTICVWRKAVADCFPLPPDLGLAVDGALLLSAARHGILHLPSNLAVYCHHGHNYFVSDPENQRYQRRLFDWVSHIPEVGSPRERKLLQALILENQAHFAVHNGGKPIMAAGNATVLLLKLAGLGLIPNWKHFGLPIVTLLGWKNIQIVIGRGRTH